MAIIYIDVLFVVNLIVNYLLIKITCIFSGLNPNRIRIVFGSFIGACYAVLAFFPNFTIIHEFIYKLLISMLIIATSSPFYSIRSYVKTVLIFYLVSFTFGGCVLGVFYFSNVGAKLGAIYSNGILYFNLPWTILAVSGLLFYSSMKLFSIISKKNLIRGHLKKELILYFQNKTAEVTAFIDTGNSLIDPITLKPVIVAEYKFIKKLFPEDLSEKLEHIEHNDLELIMSLFSSKGISARLIPFSSIGKENGMLLGFIPDKAEIHDDYGVRDLGRCVVAIHKKQLSNDKSFGALLNPYL